MKTLSEYGPWKKFTKLTNRKHAITARMGVAEYFNDDVAELRALCNEMNDQLREMTSKVYIQKVKIKQLEKRLK